MRFWQALVLYAEKYGVTKAAIRYSVSRQYVYRWKRRYDGTLQSLADRSHRPHSHPRQHTPEEIKLILNMRRRNPNAGLVVLWVKLRQRGYTRSISGLYRFLRKRGQMAVKLPNPKYTPKPYEKMQYPGQRGQIDVKFVPSVCIVGEEKGVSGINTLSSMNTAVSDIWRHLMSTVPTLQRSLSDMLYSGFLIRSNASKQTTEVNLPTVLLPMEERKRHFLNSH